MERGSGGRLGMLKPALLSLGLRLTGAGAQFAFAVYIGRLFGPVGYGIFTLSLVVATIVATVARWGFSQWLLRESSVLIARRRHGAVRRRFSEGLAIVFFLSSGCALSMYAFAVFFAEDVFPQRGMTEALSDFSLAVLGMALMQYGVEGFRSLGRVGIYSFLQSTVVPFFALSLLFVFSCDAPRAGAFHLPVLAYVVSVLIACSITLTWWIRLHGFDGAVPISFAHVWRRFRDVTPFAVVQLSSIVMGSLETLLLGFFSHAESVALYAAALRLVLIMNFVLIAVNSVLAPRMAAAHARGDESALRRAMREATLISLLLSSPLGLLYLLRPAWVLGLFGADFVAASQALVVLTLGQCVSLLCGPVMLALQMCGQERAQQKIVLLTLLLVFLLGCWLVPRWGVMGAAWSATSGMVMLNVLSYLFVRWRLVVDSR